MDPPFPLASPIMRDGSWFPASPHTQTAPTWRKVLYEKQPFEDNFVDYDHFMKELKKNQNVHVYKYREVMTATFPITQQVALVIIFCKVFYELLDRRWSASTLVSVDVIILLLSWVIYVYVRYRHFASSEAFQHASLREKIEKMTVYIAHFGRPLISLTTILFLLGPVITTLTATFSDDTIITFSIVGMVLNVMLADYQYLGALTDRYQPNFSVNSAFFAVTMMASRFDDPVKGGALVAFGAIVFALSPPARQYLNKYSRTMETFLTVLGFLASIWALRDSKSLLFIFTSGFLVVVFLFPLVFVKLHSAKSQISGPWDEAKPKNSAAAAEWANTV